MQRLNQTTERPVSNLIKIVTAIAESRPLKKRNVEFLCELGDSGNYIALEDFEPCA